MEHGDAGRDTSATGPGSESGTPRPVRQTSLVREFWRRYFFRLLVMLPLLAIVGFVPPYSLEAKLFGLTIALIGMLIAQLVEVLVYLRAREAERQRERVGNSSVDGSRKARRRQARREGLG